ncbi:Guanine-nucleotide dissociation stimulator CDC25 [Penicillium expansum]|uniref:Guanine-nucleotide dissociation stimulator CDC25 n=1 Tax=Penicillium expansum TaxID=27334 RepID=A0A0A2IA91_PENEN|nr:Guanine-nucleotide dissociation stimulator CDC25 [Penicillium expansum]KGO39984.1 Guanine-nucleotide dissociation stimulator CDC25 [Penicillium expansum]KGO53252.1 Guanine-nucleotide dissociation stimulator CDC25 [Penicillium expansum]KGO68000.1 Guanine-nucleotide dissociation stimulator CDC25 [Penicillium expansum]
MDQEDTKERRDSGSHDITSPEKLVCQYHESVEVVRAGTLAALVENLTRHDKLDGSFNRIFLTTYRHFTSGAELLELLIDRFDSSPPTLNAIQTAEWSTRIRPLIQLRVINVLRQWLEHFWSEPKGIDTDRNLRILQSFAKRAADATETSATQQLLTITQRRIAGFDCKRRSLSSISSPPKPILPRKLDKLQFLKIDATEIARQLTIMESHIFGKVQRDELLNKNWQNKESSDAPELAPNIRALIRYSNQLSNWVGAMILAESDLKKRTQVIGHLINVANICHQLQNYSAVVSILAGFESAPVYRLARTWAMVTERSCNTLRPLQAMICSAHNYQAYRDTLRVAVAPCVPFLGLFLKDLTFIEDGNAAMTPEGLINFHKYTMLASTIHEIQRLKEAPYSLRPVPELQEYLATQLQSAVDLHDMWDKSCGLEPRGRDLGNRPRDLYTPTGGMFASMIVACMVLDD